MTIVPYQNAFIAKRDFFILEVQKVGDVLDLGAGQDLRAGPARRPGLGRHNSLRARISR